MNLESYFFRFIYTTKQNSVFSHSWVFGTLLDEIRAFIDRHKICLLILSRGDHEPS